MHSANLAIVFASNLLKPIEETKDTQFNVTRVNRCVLTLHETNLFSVNVLHWVITQPRLTYLQRYRIVQLFIDHKTEMFSRELLQTCDEILKKPSPKNLEPPPSPNTLRSSSNPESNIVITLSRKTSGSISGRKGLSRKNTNEGIESSSEGLGDLRSSGGSTSSEPSKASMSAVSTMNNTMFILSHEVVGGSRCRLSGV